MIFHRRFSSWKLSVLKTSRVQLALTDRISHTIHVLPIFRCKGLRWIEAGYADRGRLVLFLQVQNWASDFQQILKLLQQEAILEKLGKNDWTCQQASPELSIDEDRLPLITRNIELLRWAVLQIPDELAWTMTHKLPTLSSELGRRRKKKPWKKCHSTRGAPSLMWAPSWMQKLSCHIYRNW